MTRKKSDNAPEGKQKWLVTAPWWGADGKQVKKDSIIESTRDDLPELAVKRVRLLAEEQPDAPAPAPAPVAPPPTT